MLNDDIIMFIDEDFDLNTRQLRSWNALSKAGAGRLLDSVESLHQQVTAYDEEIRLLMDRVHVLEKQRNLAAASLERKRSLLNPIRRLPVEVLEKIFALYCHDKHEADRGNHGVYAPFTALSHTCSLWRQVAPHAWPTIMLDLDVEISSAHVHILTHHLSVVKKMPLTVDVSCFFYYRDRQNTRLVFEMVLGCSAQWRSAQLWGSGCFSWLNERVCVLSLGRLDSLKIKGSLRREHYHGLSKVLKSATNLRRLDAGTGVDVALVELGLASSTIDSLTTVICRPLDLEVLSSSLCSNLQYLHRLRLDLQWNGQFQTSSMATLSITGGYLQSEISRLCLSTLVESDDLDLLKHLHLPRLEALDLEGNDTMYDLLRLAPLTSMLSRSNHRLQRLSMKYVRPHQGELLDVLRSTPSITQLDVEMFEDDAMSDDCFLRHLPVDPNSTARPLLPSLSTLSVFLPRSWSEGEGVEELALLKPIANMLESRVIGFQAGRVTSLSSFSLKLDVDVYDEVLSAHDVMERVR
ncbi:hypothetical protein D9758_005746 [Tetrapyrgos nigripes]|uniref:F-box domain-containing protein n=1 Tax=Tetrapyrgos nigripes TaxID=182062 RepID=A0A8H5GK74_9AGAR|nr:hypothetical protein D9758_005746 [Tetrapyrgos nigripes]